MRIVAARLQITKSKQSCKLQGTFEIRMIFKKHKSLFQDLVTTGLSCLIGKGQITSPSGFFKFQSEGTKKPPEEPAARQKRRKWFVCVQLYTGLSMALHSKILFLLSNSFTSAVLI